MRHFCAALAAVTALAFGGSAWSRPLTDAEMLTWANANVEVGTWSISTYSETFVALVREVSPGDRTRTWVRYEYVDPQLPGIPFSVRSAVVLMNIDCIGRRYGIVQTTGYESNNQMGRSRSEVPVTPTMTYAAPESIAEIILQNVCQDARPGFIPPPSR